MMNRGARRTVGVVGDVACYWYEVRGEILWTTGVIIAMNAHRVLVSDGPDVRDVNRARLFPRGRA